jgi:hypothetical protein
MAMCFSDSVRRISFILALITVSIFLPLRGNQVLADSDDDIKMDPFVVMFQAKLDEAKSEHVAQEAAVNLARTRYSTALRLLTQGAISRDEFDSLEAALKAAVAQLDVTRQRVVARQAVLEVVILNRLAGREVQQCL